MLKRVSGACGIISSLVGLTVILVAVSDSPWFSWTENHISVFGVEGSNTTLFNQGLTLAGLLSLVFAVGLGRSLLPERLARLGAFSLILGSIGIAGMGIFPRSIDLPHDVSSILFFTFTVAALLLIGAAALRSSQVLVGWLSLTGGVLMAVFQLVPWPWNGGAIPQLLVGLIWGLWITAFGIKLMVRNNLT